MKFLIATIVLFLFPSIARSQVDTISLRGFSHLHFKIVEKDFFIDISQGTKDGAPFPEDNIAIKIFDGNREIAGMFNYSSAYGETNVDIIRASNSEHCLFLLVCNHGRGPSATQKRLKILNFNSGALNEIIEIPITGYAGSGMQWSYKYQCIKLDSGWSIQLKLNKVPEGDPTVLDERYVPKYREIKIDLHNHLQANHK
jgi:hypothetical protein